MSDVRIYYVYYSSSDFASSCDPIRLDLVVDGICIKSQSTIKYKEGSCKLGLCGSFAPYTYRRTNDKNKVTCKKCLKMLVSDKTTKGN